MIKYTYLPAVFVFSLFILSCETKDEVDTEKPLIDIAFEDAFPVNCDTLYFGESFGLKLRFTDNIELGSFSIDIHNNFDHHSHSTEVSECSLNPVKSPVNPFLYIEDFDIPPGLSEYKTEVSLFIPSGNEDGDFDTGDYHFFISLTDHEGWSAQKGLSIKILRP